jgi:hypothetical protein
LSHLSNLCLDCLESQLRPKRCYVALSAYK